MEYTLVKYKYGKVKQYTAFCLTPSCEPREITYPNGNTAILTHLGPASPLARHFQTQQACLAFSKASGIPISLKVSGNWLPLSGTGILDQHPRVKC